MNIKYRKKLDKQGRIVIPMDIRRAISLKPLDELSVEIEDGKLVIEKLSDKKEARD